METASVEHKISQAPDRRTLTDPATVVEAMARDVVSARRGGVAGLVDLTEWGWTPAQVMRHAANAHALALTPAHLGGGAA